MEFNVLQGSQSIQHYELDVVITLLHYQVNVALSCCLQVTLTFEQVLRPVCPDTLIAVGVEVKVTSVPAASYLTAALVELSKL